MRTRNSILNISSGLISQILTITLNFVVRTIFIQELGATYLGINGLFTNILTLFSLAELGFGQAIIFALYKPIAQQDEAKICSLIALFKHVYLWMFGIVLSMGLLLLPFIEFFITKGTQIPHLHIIYLMFVCSSASTYLFSYKISYIIAAQKNYFTTIISYYFTIGTAIIQIISLLYLHNYFAYLGIQIIGGILQNIIIVKKINRLFPFLKNKDVLPLPHEEIQKIRKDVKALAIYKIGSISLNSTDNIIISKFIGLLSVGYYSNYYLLSTTVSNFLSTIFSNITASIGNLNASSDDSLKLTMFKNIKLATFWLYGVCSICLYTCITPFIYIWLGHEYVLTDSVSFIIAFNLYISGMLYTSFNYRQTMGLFVQGKLRPIISALENITISIILAKYFGLAGVLWGTAITRLTTNSWYDPYIVFKKGLRQSPLIYFKDSAVKLIILFFTGFICVITVKIIPCQTIFHVLLRAFISLVICNLIFILFFFRTQEFKYLFSIIQNLTNILHSKKI